jgi:hypothetical protein
MSLLRFVPAPLSPTALICSKAECCSFENNHLRIPVIVSSDSGSIVSRRFG